jgi:UDP-N-acetyl-D-glucosamine dehydrogenase
MPHSDLVVVGLGYVGLPLAQESVRSGLRVTGFDVSQRIIDALNSGTSHIDHLSDAAVNEMRTGGFSATADPSCLAEADNIVICVPTPLRDGTTPDLDAVEASTRTITSQLTSGSLVVLESTTYPEQLTMLCD